MTGESNPIAGSFFGKKYQRSEILNSRFSIDSDRINRVRRWFYRYKLSYVLTPWWWLLVGGLAIALQIPVRLVLNQFGVEFKGFNIERLFIVVSLMGLVAMLFAFALAREQDQRRRRSHGELLDYIEMLRNYSVENIESLRESMVSLQSVHAPIPPAEVPTEKDVGLRTRERETLLKIIYAMAVAKPYGFDPDAKRNEAATIIASATDAAGCSVSDDTVRKYLKEASKITR